MSTPRAHVSAFDRGWLAGYQAGRGERFWRSLRRLWLPGVVIGWVYLATARRTPDLVRVVAAFGALFVALVLVVCSPLELAWLGWRWWHRRRPVVAPERPFGPADTTAWLQGR